MSSPDPRPSWAPPEMSAEFLAAIVQHVAHPVFVKDRHFRFVLVNPALCRMVGYSAEEMIGKSDHDFFPKEQADFFRQKDTELFATGSSVSIEEEPITDAAGDKHILSTTKVPLRGPNGEVTHLVGIIHEITQLKVAEDVLRRANEELEQRVQLRTGELRAAQAELLRKERLAVLGQLCGGLAHQIRNPLGVIQNAVALLARSGESRAERQHALDIVREEVARANRIITDLLDYARVRPPELERVNVHELVSEVVASETVGPDLGLDVRVESDLTALCDSHQTRTALGNIVRNAIEAMPRGGTITIEGRRDAGRVLISVRDTGEGVDEEARQRLFDPLVTTKPTGVGLGLSTAKNLIENQGGSIRFSSERGYGAVFVLELPAS